jgi:hypothetical protein
MPPESLRQAPKEAKLPIRSLTALGITEQFEKSVQCIAKILDFSALRSIEVAHRTDDFPTRDRRFQRIEPVKMTAPDWAALDDLVSNDEVLYKLAVAAFERRYARTTPGSVPIHTTDTSSLSSDQCPI